MLRWKSLDHGVFVMCLPCPDTLEQNMTQPHGHVDFLAIDGKVRKSSVQVGWYEIWLQLSGCEKPCKQGNVEWNLFSLKHLKYIITTKSESKREEGGPCSGPQLLLLLLPPFMSLAVYSPLTLHDSTFGFRAGGSRWTSGVEVSLFEDDMEEDTLADELDLELASPSSSSDLSPLPPSTQHLARTMTGCLGSTLHGWPGCWGVTGMGCREDGQGVLCLLQAADMQPPQHCPALQLMGFVLKCALQVGAGVHFVLVYVGPCCLVVLIWPLFVLYHAHLCLFVLVCVHLCFDGSVHKFATGSLSCIKWIVSTCII